MRVLGRKTLWEGRFLRTLLINYRDSNGSTREWEAVERVNCDGVVVAVPMTAEGDVILIRQFRPALDNHVMELPAGLISPGESPLDACRRELLEETGHYSDNLVPVTTGVMSTGINSEVWTVVLAKDAKKAPPELLAQYPPDDNEEIETIRMPLSGLQAGLEKFRREGDFIDLRIFGIIEACRTV